MTINFVRRDRYIFIVLILLVSFVHPVLLYAHDGKKHIEEIHNALGLEQNSKSRKWIHNISYCMIDDYASVISAMQRRYPGFNISKGWDHRAFFHWHYNGKPWNARLDKIVERNAQRIYKNNFSDYVDEMKAELSRILIEEHRRRNRKMNQDTEILFYNGPVGGRAGTIANRFTALVYDLHILGDYMSDNGTFDGLAEFNALVGGIIESINTIDRIAGKDIVRHIRNVLKSTESEQSKADQIMAIIQKDLPRFISKADDGRIKHHLKEQGFEFK